MKLNIIHNLVAILYDSTGGFEPPLINTIIDEFGHSPFLILIGCLLSLRARDSTTVHVCRTLFTLVKTPAELLALSRPELEKIIFKTGYYKNKAQVLHEVSESLITHHGSTVPATLEELLEIKGVGPKTANLVLGMAFDEPSICVDTHVHRISNRLGLIKTTTPEQTELALKKILPKPLWIHWNYLLVMWGQNICHPVSPKCSSCPIQNYCRRSGVKKSR